MSKVEEIKQAIQSLSEDDYNRIWEWFDRDCWETWDKEIAKDSAVGDLDFLIREISDVETYDDITCLKPI